MADVNDQLKKVGEMYSKNIKDIGQKSSAVGWNTSDCQSLRFDKLTSYIIDKSYSVNDYGCGFGSHLKYLTNDLGHDVQVYNGYDISEEMLESAKIYLDYYKGDLLLKKQSIIDTEADYSFVSGTFNVRFESSEKLWEDFIKKKLVEINLHSTKGFSFNMLTSYADWEEPHLYYGNPNYWFDYCKKNFSKKVSLLHDYDLWEWTITVIKES